MKGSAVKRGLAALLAAALSLFGCTAQDACSISAAQREEDARFLIEAMEQEFVWEDLLPKAGAATTLQEDGEVLLQAVKAARTDKEFLQSVAVYLNRQRSGHTALVFANGRAFLNDLTATGQTLRGKDGGCSFSELQDKLRYWDTLFFQDSLYCIPFYAYYAGGDYVVVDPVDSGIAPGSVITQVNGLPVEEAVAQTADQHLDGALYDGLQHQIAVPRLLMVFLDDGPRDYTVTWRQPDGAEKSAAFTTVSAQEMTAQQSFSRPMERVEQIAGKTAAYVAVPSMYSGQLQKARAFLLEHRDADALILDLRGNSGGAKISLFSFLNNSGGPVADPGTFFMKETARGATQLQGAAPFALAGRSYLSWRSSQYFSPGGEVFQGEIFLLTDAACASATEQLLQLMRGEGVRATVIGTPTRGMLGIVGSPPSVYPSGLELVALPNSGLAVMIEPCGYVAADGTLSDAGGTTPDVALALSAQDYQACFAKYGSTALPYATEFDPLYRECLARLS